jgi:sensor histidine kinase YesM
MRGWAIAGLKLLGFTVMVTGGSMVVMGMLRAALPLQAGLYLSTFFVHALFISALCWQVVPRLGKWSATSPFAFRWTILLSALLGMAIGGTAVASIAVHYTFGEMREISAAEIFGEGLRVAIPVTLIVGTITTVVMAGRSRLKSSEAVVQEHRLKRETAEKLAAQAKLASLSSRVQPHFLFNTLNSIAALIRENPAEAEHTLERLASLLRSSLDNAGIIPLDQELKLVRDYLEIQKTRMGDRLTFQIAIDSDLHAAVPPFSVQTLVENSVKHAAAKLERGLDVRVRASRYDSQVAIYVTDNGPGFDPAFMKAGHGLDNLQARLRAVYGDRAALDFFREPERMTIRLRVPQDESLSG